MARFALALTLVLVAGAALPRPTRADPAAPADVVNGMAVTMSGFTLPQEQTIRNGLALFADLISPSLRLPTTLRLSAVPGTGSLTYSAWSGGHLLDVWVTFGVDNLGVPQVVHELVHVAQAENPYWAARERAYADAHPYPRTAVGMWIGAGASPPMEEYCPRTVELLLDGDYTGDLAAQPDAIRFCLWQLSAPI